MPRKPTPPPPELEAVREVAAVLADVDELAGLLRAERDKRIAIAKLAGATGDQLADAANLSRRNAYEALSAAGLDISTWHEPGRIRAAARRRLEGTDAVSEARKAAIVRRLQALNESSEDRKEADHE